jgi:hypothetical protein
MAKFRYTNLVDGPFGMGDLYSMSPSFELRKHSGSSAIFKDTGSGNAIGLYGEGLTFKGDKMTDGQIDKIRFVDDHGHAYIVATKGNYDAATLSKNMREDIPTLFQQLFAREDTILGNGSDNYLIGAGSDDVIKGRGGWDQIFAAGGRDVLTGGGGSDLFMFTGVSDVDIITDFNSDDDATSHDVIATTLDLVDIRQVGSHTIVEFAKGNIVKLLNVDATTVTDMDDIGYF